jgi:hypothetical protein
VSRITVVGSGANLSLPEYRVGKASTSCIYPGIGQCFAIAGWAQDGMVCTHVSPGSTQDEIADTFHEMGNLGGDTILYWYVVGPFVQHFAEKKAQWRKAKDVLKSFEKSFKNKSASHFILDASAERNTQVLEPGFTIPRTWSSIDIRAERRSYESMVIFSFKEGSPRVKDWTRFNNSKFVRL